MACRKKLAIVVNRQCARNSPSSKTWFHFRSFVLKYPELLSSYTLLVSEDTKAILLEVESQLKTLLGSDIHFIVEDLGNSRAALNNIVNRKPGEIERILWFLDPKGLPDQLEMAPLRLIAERGHKFHMNFGAALWAEHEWTLQPHSEIRPIESLVLVEENAIASMFEFISDHFDAINMFPQIEAPLSVRKMIEIVLRQNQTEEKPKLASPSFDPNGELLGIANRILSDAYNTGAVPMQPAQGARFHVVAFADYKDEQAPGIEMQKFFEVCADPRLRVNLLVNRQTAQEWIRQFEGPKLSRCAGADS